MDNIHQYTPMAFPHIVSTKYRAPGHVAFSCVGRCVVFSLYLEVLWYFGSQEVWCGLVGWGLVWCGVVWCGVVWCGVVQCDAVRCGAVWCVRVRVSMAVLFVPVLEKQP